MKKLQFFCILLVVLLLAGCASKVTAKGKFDPGCEKLSEMSDEKLLDFIEFYKIDVSAIQTPAVDWMSYVRSVIVSTEDNPNNGYLGSRPDMQAIFYSIVDAVNHYYGVKPEK